MNLYKIYSNKLIINIILIKKKKEGTTSENQFFNFSTYFEFIIRENEF